jgi:hypothetical protein
MINVIFVTPYKCLVLSMDKLWLTGRALGWVFNFRSGCMHHTLHLQPGVAKQPNFELKTRPKQLLGSLPLVIALLFFLSLCPLSPWRTLSLSLFPSFAASLHSLSLFIRALKACQQTLLPGQPSLAWASAWTNFSYRAPRLVLTYFFPFFLIFPTSISRNVWTNTHGPNFFPLAYKQAKPLKQTETANYSSEALIECF